MNTYFRNLLDTFHEGTADDITLAALGRYDYYHHDELEWGLTPNEETLPADRIEDFVKACCAFGWWEGNYFADVRALYAYMKTHLAPERWSIYDKFLNEDGDLLCFFPEYQRTPALDGPFYD